MTRRFWFKCLAWTIGWLGWTGIRTVARADEQQATLNEMLRSVLRCRRPQEFAYVNLVTAKVDAGELPAALVLSMMNWARDRSKSEMKAGRRKSDIPFPYFQEGMRLRAAQIGVSLPGFTG